MRKTATSFFLLLMNRCINIIIACGSAAAAKNRRLLVVISSAMFLSVLLSNCGSESKKKSDSEVSISKPQTDSVISSQEEKIDSAAILQARIRMQNEIYSNFLDFNGQEELSFEVLSIYKLTEQDMQEKGRDGEENNELLINGYTVGEYYGTMFALLYGDYGDGNYGLKQSVVKYLSQNITFKDTSDIEVFGKLANVAPFSEGTPDLPFKNLNPEFADWTAENLVPLPTESIWGHSYQSIYNSVMQSFFRKLSLAYIYLERVYDKEKYIALYKEQIAKEPEYCTNFLRKSLEVIDMVDYRGKVISSYDSYVHMGFWLRRYMDGSAAEVKSALDKIMNRFDNDWYRSSFSKELDYVLISRKITEADVVEPCDADTNRYYSLKEDIYFYEKPSLKELPVDMGYSNVGVVRVDSLFDEPMTSGGYLGWAKCKILKYSKPNYKWVYCKNIADTYKNFQFFDSLSVTGGFDTINGELHFKLAIRNNSDKDINVPKCEIKLYKRNKRMSGTTSVMDIKPHTFQAGSTSEIINDKVVMTGNNRSQIWYAPKSNKSTRIFYYSKRKGAFSMKYVLNCYGIDSKPLNEKLVLPLDENLVDTRKYKSWLEKAN